MWTSYKDTIVVFVTLYADGWPPCTLSNYAGSADSRRIFSRTGNRVYGRTHFPGMKINFWLERGVLGHTIYLTLSSSDSGVHLSRLPQQQDLCCRGAARFLQRHRCEPLSLLMSWLFTAILMSNLGVVCCFEICPNNKDPSLVKNLWCSVLL